MFSDTPMDAPHAAQSQDRASVQNPPSPARVRFVAQGQVVTFVLITSLFFAWGLAANMTDTLLAAFKRILSLSDFQTTFVQYAFFGAYFCFAIPASMTVKRFGYKAGILVGLGLYIAGALLFFPASLSLKYEPFLVALYILAAGLSFLETSANPYIYSLGPARTATQRLNFAQAFNPVGSITGALLAQFFILNQLHHASASERAAMGPEALEALQKGELAAVMGPYVGVALVLAIIFAAIALLRMPAAGLEQGAVQGELAEEKTDLVGSLKRLIANRRYVSAVLVQFLYVGAQVGVWSFTIRYVMDRLHVNEADAAGYYTFGLVLFFISRFLCTWLMSFIRAEALLALMAAIAVVLCLLAAVSHGMIGVYAVVAVSGCMSLMFPTIYGMGLSGLGPDTKVGGAGLVMAIVGGAVIAGLQGLMSDLTGSIGLTFLLPAACFGAVMVFGLRVRGSGGAQ